MIKNFFTLIINKNHGFSEYKLEIGEKSNFKIFKNIDFETLIFGNPSYSNNIDLNQFYSDWKNKYKKNFLDKIDGEFIILELNKRDNSITIINSRFASPTLYYYVDSTNIFLSNNYFKIAKILKKKNSLSLDNNSLYEFFKFRRLFGNKTLDINTKFLMPASKLIISKNQIDLKKYWHPNYKKNSLSLKDNAELLKNEMIKSWKFLLSDKKKPILLLSGGLDTRFALATCPVTLDCLNYSYHENRESEAAKQSCKVTNQKFIWKKLYSGKYRDFHEYSSCVNSSMHVADAVHYGHDDITDTYDCVFSGYAIDWFFQGWYSPYDSINFLGQQLYLKIPKKIDDNIIDFFLKNCLFLAKGHSIDKFIKDKELSALTNNLNEELENILKEIQNYSDNKNDWYDYLNIGNPSRKYSYGAQLCIKEYGEHRILPFTNNLYDLYLQLPNSHKFDSRVERLALVLSNNKLANIPSGNTGYKVKYGSLMQTVCSGFKFFNRIIRFKPRNTKLQRTWMEFDELLRSEYSDEVIKLKKNQYINDLNFIDMDKVNKYIDNWHKGDEKISSHFLMLMLTFASFMKNINS